MCNRKICWKSLWWQLALPLTVGGAAALLTSPGMKQSAQLPQPVFAPPGWVFAVVWSALYLLMGISNYRVWRAPAVPSKKRPSYWLYAVQLALTLLWPLLFFSWRLYLPALICLLVLLGVVILWLTRLQRVDRPAAWLQTPYLLWLLFAACLNLATLPLR